MKDQKIVGLIGLGNIVESVRRKPIALLVVLTLAAGCGGGSSQVPLFSIDPIPPITPPISPVVLPDPPVTPPDDDDDDRHTLDLPEPDGNLPDPLNPGTVDPISDVPAPISANYNQNSFQLVRLGDAYARDLTGKDMVIGVMEEVNHFHAEIAGDVEGKPKIHPGSVLTSPYSIFYPLVPVPDEKFVVDFASWDQYPTQACYVEFGFPCADETGNTKYFVRMPDGELRLIPGVEDFTLTNARTGQQERSEFGTLHGTAVASVAAAGMNEEGHEDRIPLYGIAHEAQILVYARPMFMAGLSSSVRNQAVYFRNAPAAADVYNFSHAYGYEVEDPAAQSRQVTRSGFRLLANAIEASDRVMVAAAGNDRHDYPQFPAAFPLFFPDLRGQVIAVASVGENGDLAFYSNHCGDLPSDWNPELHGVHYCLAAPGGDRSDDGEGIWVATSHRIEGDDDRFSYTEAQGSSFASPLVAGAFTLVKQQSRGSLSDEEIVFRLLQTANRTGKFAEVETYGAGLLDLDAATSPAGMMTMTVPVQSAEAPRFDDPAAAAFPLDDSRLFISPAFGSGLARALGEREIAVFDELGMPFWYTLDTLFSLSPRRAKLPQRRAGLFPLETLLPTPGGGTLSLSSRGERVSPWGERYGTPDPDEEHDARISLRQPVRGEAELLFAAGDLSRSVPLGLHEDSLQEDNLHDERDFPHPYLSLAGEGLGLGGSLEAGAGRITALGFTGSEMPDSRTSEREGKAHGGLLEYGLAPVPGMRIGLQAGALFERRHSLGLRGEGGFGGMADSSTAFAGISWDAEMSARWRFHARLLGGLTRMGAPSDSLIADWSAASTSAFQLGFAGMDVLQNHDKLSFSVRQPLRVEGGSADFLIPAGRTQEGALLHESVSDVPLAPSGRELEISSRYEVGLDESTSLILDAGAVIEGGHNAGRDPELFALGGVRLRF